MKQYFRLLSLLLVLMMTSSCSKDDDPVADSPQPQIIFLFSPGGLGDMSYNDCILEGVQRFKLEQPETDIYIYSPESLDEAEKNIFRLACAAGKQHPCSFSCLQQVTMNLYQRNISKSIVLPPIKAYCCLRVVNDTTIRISILFRFQCMVHHISPEQPPLCVAAIKKLPGVARQ